MKNENKFCSFKYNKINSSNKLINIKLVDKLNFLHLVTLKVLS